MDAAHWDERYAKAELEWGTDPNHFLVQEIDGMEPGRALDLAAGEGRNSVWLAAEGWNVTAVDFSRVAIDKARLLAERRGVEVEWVVADLRDFEAPRQGFDLVIMFYLHLTAPERRKVLGKAAETLRPEGTLLIVGHDRANLTDGVGGPSDPALLLDAEEVASELVGLVIDKAERVVRPVKGSDRDALDTLVRARKP